MDNIKKHRFNLIDVFVILIVLALAASTVYFAIRESGDKQSQIRERKITYTVCLKGVDKEFLSSFEEEAHVLFSSTLNYAGTISKVTREKASVFTDEAVHNNSGNNYIVVQKQYDDVYDVYVTLTSRTTLDDRGVAYIDRQRITIGTEVGLRFGNFSCNTYITSFSVS